MVDRKWNWEVGKVWSWGVWRWKPRSAGWGWGWVGVLGIGVGKVSVWVEMGLREGNLKDVDTNWGHVKVSGRWGWRKLKGEVYVERWPRPGVGFWAGMD